MHLRLTFTPESAGVTTPISDDDARALAAELQATLAERGIDSQAAQDAGHTVTTDHYVTIAVRPDGLTFSSDEHVNAPRQRAAHVIQVLRALDSRLKVSDADWRGITARAAEVAVNDDGTIDQRPLDRQELDTLAWQLFDHADAQERIRPWAEEFVTARNTDIRTAARDAVPIFRAAIAVSPAGGDYDFRMPREASGHRLLPGFDALQHAMQTVLDDALTQPWQATGLPTGIIVTKTPAKIESYLVFDNLLGSGALDPELLDDPNRTAPHAWQDVSAVAAQRDPRFQPTWLPEAIVLLDRAGRSVTINEIVTASEDAQPTGVRDIRVPVKKAPPPPREPRKRLPPEPYLPPLPPEKKPGVLGRLFGRKK